jgi:hypothetical protein
VPTNPYEYVGGAAPDTAAGNKSILKDRGRGQVVATISNYNSNFGYTVSNSWFTVNGSGQIVTSNTYNADYENSGDRGEKTFTVTAKNPNACNDFQNSDPLTLKVTIRAWNDKKFVTKEVTGEVNLGGEITINSSACSSGDDDYESAKNIVLVRGVLANTGTSGWNAVHNPNLVKTLAIQNGGGANVKVADDGKSFTFYSSALPKNTPAVFYVLARDSADYGYPTDYYDEWVKVSITVNYPPLPGAHSIKLCKYDSLTINVNSIPGLGSTEAGAPFTFATSPSPSSKRGSSVSVTLINSNKDLKYNLKGVAPTFGYTDDTITYTVQNSKGQTAEGKIIVTIDPVKDKKPTSGLDTVTAIIGDNYRTPTLSRKWNYNVNSKKAELKVKEITAQPGKGVVVTVVDSMNGIFNINTPATGISVSEELTFTYTIVDKTDYGTCKDREDTSEPITVTIKFKEPEATAAKPVPDTIIVFQGKDTTKLWDGIKNNLLANDLKSTNNIFIPEEAELGKESGDSTKYGKITLNSNGTFKYEHNGGFETTDGFSYYVYSNAPSKPISDQSAYVSIYINLLNLHEPTLTEKTESVNAEVLKKFTVIDGSDKDLDTATILKLDASKGLTAKSNGSLDVNAKVEIVGDSAITFKYDAKITETLKITVTFWVNDSVDYVHKYYNNGALGSTPYHDYGSYEDSIIVTVIPNPQAVDYTMTVKELEETSKLFKDGKEYINLKSGILYTENVSSFTFALEDSTQNGRVILDKVTGVVIYKHENADAFSDSFVYKLIYTFADGSKDSTTGKVLITVTSREPWVIKDGSFYEDTDGNGKIDKITIAFDRKMNFDDRVDTDYLISFAKLEFGTNETERWAVGKTENGDDDSTIVIIWLKEKYVPADVTGGDMSVVITYPDKYNTPNATVTVADKAAPVIKGLTAEYIKSLVPDGKDTLILTMSESSDIRIKGGNLPFKFVKKDDKDSYYTVSFVEIIGDKYVVGAEDSQNGRKIFEGDSVFVNPEGNVRDLDNNYQTIEGNKRVEIVMKTVTQINSAVYLDTNTVHDGYIDIIRLNLGMDVDTAFANKLVKALELSKERNFDSVKVTSIKDGIIELSVVEYAAKFVNGKDGKRNGPPRTGLLSDDSVKVLSNVVSDDGLLTVKAYSTPVTDSVAPVIVKGIYNVGADTTLDVVYSEPVIAQSGNPYKFWHRLPAPKGELFDMGFAPGAPTQQGNNTLRYKVISSTVTYPLAEDSIWIVSGGYIEDNSGNVQDLTVRAPLELKNKYPSELDLYVVPQPLYMIKVGDKRYEAKLLDKKLMEYYNIPESKNKGVALVLEAKGPLSTDLSKHQGFIKVIDQTGNGVTEEIPMVFTTIADGERQGNVVGVAVWDGKNTSGRNVGASTYLALVQVEVQFDDRDGKEVRAYRKVIAVTTANEVLK